MQNLSTTSNSNTTPLLEQSCTPQMSRRNLVTVVHGIWHGSEKGRGNPKIYDAFCFICNLGCLGNKQTPSQYHARKVLAPVWTRCPDGVRWCTEIVVKVAPNTKTATPNTAVRAEQLHSVMNHMDIACLLCWTAPEPNGYRLFKDVSNYVPVMSFIICQPYSHCCLAEINVSSFVRTKL